MKIMAKTRFGLVDNWHINSRFYPNLNKSQIKRIVNRLNKFCDNYRVYMTATGSIRCRKKEDCWFTFYEDVNGFRWLKSDMKDKDYDPYYYLGVDYFYLVEDV